MGIPENQLVVGEGDRIVEAFVEQTHDNDGWVMRWNIVKLDGTEGYQNFWGNETLQDVDLSYIKGQFIKTIAIIDASSVRITFSNESSIELLI